MKKKVLLIVIPIVLVIIIAISIVIGIILKKKNESEDEILTGSTWGDTYYAYLKEAIKEKDLNDAEEKYGMMLDMKDAKLQFCGVEENQDPTMIMTYKKNESSYVNVYQITDDKKVVYIAYKQPTEVEYLYDIEKDEYSWYVHTKETSSDSYSSLKNIVNNLNENSTKSEESDNVNIAELEADYTINEDEAEITQETVNGETLSISKLDEIFVKPEIEQNKQIDFDVDIKEKDLKEGIATAVQDYKNENQKLTDEIKENVSKKVEEIKAKKEEIEKAKKEVEEKKAAEEAKKGLKVGNYTLNYGKYVGVYAATGETLVLNADGTCQLTTNWSGEGEKVNNYKYKVDTYDFAQDITPHYSEGIGLLNEDGTLAYRYMPLSNTSISDGDMNRFDYSGTVDSSKTTTSSNDVQTNNTSSNTTSSKSNTQSSEGQLTSFEYDTSANDPISAGTYYRDKGSGTESVLEIKNPTGNSFEFSINAIYMTQAGYPNLGEASGTAKAIKGGGYVYTTHEDGEYGYDYNIFFRIAGGGSNPTITIEDECYMYSLGKTEISPLCGHNVTFEGSYTK
jgi:hypothetical protein